MCNRGNAAVFAVVCALGASSDVARAQDFHYYKRKPALNGMPFVFRLSDGAFRNGMLRCRRQE